MEATDRSAQDWFRLMIDMGLAPGLRALGFEGTGRRFRMEIDNHWAEITLLQAPSLTSGRVRFTLLLSILHRDEWAEQLRVRPYYPSAGARPTLHTTWESPIGAVVMVAGHPIDSLWWELEVGQPFDSLSQEVLTTLRHFGLPALSAHIHP